MRDPERIARISAKVQKAWECVPDWRFGQLVSNLLGPGPKNVFLPEDDKWERLLDHFIEERTARE